MATPLSVEETVQGLLHHMDTEPGRDGLKDTPKRYKKFLAEFLRPDPFEMRFFDNDGYDEMVIQKNIAFYSLCEHHLMPFFGEGTIAYMPDAKVVGLSKLARVLDHF